jgi:two-component system chemotaxis sensor kinase CheA
LTRIELGWSSVIRGGDRKLEPDLLRDMHTLKGDARVVGLNDLAVVCQKLEDLCFAAKRVDYAVGEEIDLLVMMAIQFAQMYLRALPGRTRTMDIAGFARQIEEALAELEEHGPFSAPSATLKIGRATHAPPKEEEAAPNFNVAATIVFLEHLRADGAARIRLRQAWEILARDVREREALPIAPVLTRDASAATDLGAQLDKEVEVQVDVGTLRASGAVIDALHVAVVHGLGNAIDHGIESPDERVAAGKPKKARIRLHAAREGDDLVVLLDDDGRGIDLEKVRAQAVKRGVVGAEAAGALSDDELIQLLFLPGFSTKEHAENTISGRGIGMDAVRDGIVRLGGNLELVSSAGRGTKLVIRIPSVAITTHALCFVAPNSDIEFALPPAFKLLDRAAPAAPRIQPFALAGLDAPRGFLPKELPLFGVRDETREFSIALEAAPTRRPLLRRYITPESERTEIVESDGREIVMLRPL